MSTTSSPLTDFDRARYGNESAAADACAFCKRGITEEYFRVAGHLACHVCARNAEAVVPPDSQKAYTRGLLFAAAAAVAGCIGYATFGILTGITLGYAAIGVGWLVGWAMRKGSKGIGGRRYQVAAALLTYAAVAVAFVPMALHEHSEARQQSAASETAGQRMQSHEAGVAENDAANAHETGAVAKPGPGRVLLSLLLLLGIGLVSPFLLFTASVGSGLLNLFILFLGVRAAWQLTGNQRPQIDGPFSTTNPATP